MANGFAYVGSTSLLHRGGVMEALDEMLELRRAFREIQAFNMQLIDQLATTRAQLSELQNKTKLYEQALETSARMEDFFRDKLGNKK